LEVSEKFIYTSEGVATFLVIKVAMISLPGFVVIAGNANLIDHIGQSVLEVVV